MRNVRYVNKGNRRTNRIHFIPHFHTLHYLYKNEICNFRVLAFDFSISLSVLIYIYKHIYMYVCICNIVILKHMFLSVKRQLGSFLLPGKLPSLQGLKTGAKTRKHTEKTHIHRDLSADQPLPQQGKAHVPHLAPDRLAFWLFTGSREKEGARDCICSSEIIHLRELSYFTPVLITRPLCNHNNSKINVNKKVNNSYLFTFPGPRPISWVQCCTTIRVFQCVGCVTLMVTTWWLNCNVSAIRCVSFTGNVTQMAWQEINYPPLWFISLSFTYFFIFTFFFIETWNGEAAKMLYNLLITQFI